MAPIASEAVGRIDVLVAIEREINGLTPQQRVGVRTERSRPLVVRIGGLVARAARTGLQEAAPRAQATARFA